MVCVSLRIDRKRRGGLRHLGICLDRVIISTEELMLYVESAIFFSRNISNLIIYLQI
jgi:hypothetical protein